MYSNFQVIFVQEEKNISTENTCCLHTIKDCEDELTLVFALQIVTPPPGLKTIFIK